jgi:hypothetical protein
VGLELTSVEISGAAARWSRDEGELTLVPQRGLVQDECFDIVTEYEGVPEALTDGPCWGPLKGAAPTPTTGACPLARTCPRIRWGR